MKSAFPFVIIVNMKNLSRCGSFILLTFIYLFCTAVGVYIALALPYAPWLNLLIADVAATLITFIFSLLLRNASVYDPYWSFAPLIIVVFLAVRYPLNPYLIMLMCVVCIWGVRLTANWAYTFMGIQHQDWRYTMLAQKTKWAYPLINLIGIHLVPTLVVYGCMLPVLFAFTQGATLNAGGVIFLVVSLLAVTLQGTADCQMHAFRKRKKQGKTNDVFIRDGLWKYARHPNYLGEILMWWGVGASVVCVLPSHWWLLAGALVNTLLFVFISIPLAEGKLAGRYQYDEYKKQTNYLLPIPLKKQR